MTRDVYAGDEYTEEPADARSPGAVTFEVTVERAPDSLARVANVVAMTNLVPRTARLFECAEELMTIQITVDGCSEVTAEFLRRKLEQLTCTVSASVSPASRDRCA